MFENSLLVGVWHCFFLGCVWNLFHLVYFYFHWVQSSSPVFSSLFFLFPSMFYFHYFIVSTILFYFPILFLLSFNLLRNVVVRSLYGINFCVQISFTMPYDSDAFKYKHNISHFSFMLIFICCRLWEQRAQRWKESWRVWKTRHRRERLCWQSSGPGWARTWSSVRFELRNIFRFLVLFILLFCM